MLCVGQWQGFYLHQIGTKVGDLNLQSEANDLQLIEPMYFFNILNQGHNALPSTL